MGCYFREGCLLPNENTNSNLLKMSNEEVVRKWKGSHGRHLGPCYVTATPWPAELFRLDQPYYNGAVGWADLVVMLKRIFYTNESKVGGFLVCLRDCFNQVKINKDGDEGQRHSREVPSQKTSVLHNYNSHLFTVSQGMQYNAHTFTSRTWLRESKSPLAGAVQNESCDAQWGPVTKNQSSHSFLFYVQRRCGLTWLHHTRVTCVQLFRYQTGKKEGERAGMVLCKALCPLSSAIAPLLKELKHGAEAAGSKIYRNPATCFAFCMGTHLFSPTPCFLVAWFSQTYEG